MHKQLAAVAAGNGGPFTRRQALSVGYSGKAVDYRVRTDSWLALRRGIYVDRELFDACRDDRAARHALDVAATCLAFGTADVVGSHESAAIVHGLDLLRKPPVAVTVTCPPEFSGRSSRPGVHLHSAGLPAAHRCRSRSLNLTSVARTVVDLARRLPYEEAVVVADSALRGGLADIPQFQAVLRDCWTWPGIRRAIRAVGFADPGAESVLESLARLLFQRYGLPTPQTQVLLGDDWAPIGRVDFYWPEYAVICEADGMRKYDRPHALRAEKLRHEALIEAGYDIVRITWDDVVHRPERTIRRLRAAFERGPAGHPGRS